MQFMTIVKYRFSSDFFFLMHNFMATKWQANIFIRRLFIALKMNQQNLSLMSYLCVLSLARDFECQVSTINISPPL